mgnify:FL=1
MLNQKKKLSIKNKLLVILISLIALTAIIFLTISALNTIIEPEGFVTPDYDKIDIKHILTKSSLSEEDYKELFYQTGLGKSSIDELLKNKQTGIDDILRFQYNFFADRKVLCEKIGIITSQESFVDNQLSYKYGFELAPYKEGYVLITKATHSLGWRHGHAAIVTDAQKGYTLEAIILGQNSQYQNINKWRIYPSFIMLKLKNAPDKKLKEIAAFSKKYMNNMPYVLTIGLLSSKNPSTNNIKGTQCSHLVWYPFKQFGYDTDSDGSWLVTPKDIANSDLFEVVQIYGVDPKEIWP